MIIRNSLKNESLNCRNNVSMQRCNKKKETPPIYHSENTSNLSTSSDLTENRYKERKKEVLYKRKESFLIFSDEYLEKKGKTSEFKRNLLKT